MTSDDFTLAELAQLFEDNRDMHGKTHALSPAERARIVAATRTALADESPSDLMELTERFVHEGLCSEEVRQAWLATTSAQPAIPSVQIHPRPVGSRVRYCLYSTTGAHVFSVASGGSLADYKVRSVRFFGDHWVYEHNLIVSTMKPREVRFESHSANTNVDPPTLADRPASPTEGRPRGRSASAFVRRLLDRDWWQNRKVQLAIQLARRGVGRSRYAHAWLLADRKHQAADNAEALFRYLRAHRPEINAWFALSPHIPAYRELSELGSHVVKYGSMQHVLLLAHAEVFASSQSDPGSRNPFAPFLTQSWLFVYLKHGVIHTDHHRRFNPMQIHLTLSATPDEHHSLIDEPGPYRFTPSEVALTGMPRHDMLERQAEELVKRGKPRDVLLIAPTWRIYLATPNLDHVWTLTEGAEQSEYATNWSALLHDERLRTTCETHGLRPVLLMHPRFQHLRSLLAVPEWMETAGYDDKVPELFARTQLTVTDYSSVAFETAYVGSPTVYFQFDRDTFFAGGHSSQQGEYDYETQGFGPVVQSPQAAVSAVAEMLAGDLEPGGEFAHRIQTLYKWRDDSNSSRVTEAIETLIRNSR